MFQLSGAIFRGKWYYVDMATIQVEDTEELPICPHCDKEIKIVKKQEVGTAHKHIIYICPNCKKVLNIVSIAYGY